MIGADTNIILRFLTRDNEEQAQKVKRILEEGETFYINEVVLVEVYYVLTKVYQYSETNFVRSIDKLLEIEGIEFFDRDIVKGVIKDIIAKKSDFEDSIINQLNTTKELYTLTFDKKASKLPGMKLLE